MAETCTHGVRYVRDAESATRFHYDYSDECGKVATGTTVLGGHHPRCDEHRARHYVVAAGTSFTLTTHLHDDPESAKREVIGRLGHLADLSFLRRDPDHPCHRQLARNLSRCSARPATDADIERFRALVEQNKTWTAKAVREHLAAR